MICCYRCVLRRKWCSGHIADLRHLTCHGEWRRWRWRLRFMGPLSAIQPATCLHFIGTGITGPIKGSNSDFLTPHSLLSLSLTLLLCFPLYSYCDFSISSSFFFSHLPHSLLFSLFIPTSSCFNDLFVLLNLSLLLSHTLFSHISLFIYP